MSRSAAVIVGLALVASHAPAPATAQDLGYVGTTQATFRGDVGYFAPHRACRDEFNAVWCTTLMILEHPPRIGAIDPPLSGGWINPVYVGAKRVRDPGQLGVPEVPFDVTVANDFEVRTLNCFSWLEAGPLFQGLALRPAGPGSARVAIDGRSCATSRPAACCGGAPVFPGFPDFPVPFPDPPN